MDSGVHVWSTPFGYCDDDVGGCIKDEEEVSVGPDGSLPDPGTEIWDPHSPPSDPLSISAADAPADFEDFLTTSDDGVSQLPAGPSSVLSVPAESPAEEMVPLVGQDGPSDGLWFKAEPVDESALAAAPPPDDPLAWGTASSRNNYGYPPSPEGSPLSAILIDPESGRQLFVCKLCRRSHKQKRQLDEHYNTAHPGYRPYKCDVCGHRYRKEAFARLHRKLHTGQRDYVCDTCGKGFISRSRLTVHRKMSRLCPASKNVDRVALERRLNGTMVLSASEREQVAFIRRRLLEDGECTVGSPDPVVIDVPDSP